MEQEYEYKGKLLEVVYENGWSTYEEWGSIRIFQDSSGDFYQQEGGHSVMVQNQSDWGRIEPIPGEYVLELIDDWEELMKSECI